MTIESVCSGCGKRLAVAESSVGKQIRCPACGAVFRLETPSLSLPVATPISSPSPEQQLSGVANALNLNPIEEYWVQSPEGNIYGPCNRTTLDRWQVEGRIDSTFRVRLGEGGVWQPIGSLVNNQGSQFALDAYRPSANAGSYAPSTDRSGLLLALGIGSWVVSILGISICVVFISPIGTVMAIIGWILSSQDLKAMERGILNPQNIGNVRAAYYMCVVHFAFSMICLIGTIASIILFIIGANAGNN